MKSTLLIITILSATRLSLIRSAETPTVLKIRGFKLEEGKPIQLSQSYDRVEITQVSGTIYTDTLSQLGNVSELSIFNSELHIQPGALCSSPVLRSLELRFPWSDDYSNQPLNKDIFKNCEKLEELYLAIGKQQQVGSQLLENVSNLKKLVIYYAVYSRVDENTFMLPKSLTSLTFWEGDLLEIDPDTFKSLENLEEISFVEAVYWFTFPKNLFKHNSKLRKLELVRLCLHSLTWDEFEGPTSLEELNLSGNRIKSFNASKIAKSFPHLKTLDVVQNKLPEGELNTFSEELKSKLPGVVLRLHQELDWKAFYLNRSCDNVINIYKKH